MKLTRSSTGLVVREGLGFHVYVLGLAALYPLWVFLAEGRIPREQLTGSLVVPAIALLLMAFFAEVAEYKFSAVTGSLHWWKRTPFARHEGSVALGDIEEVQVTTRQNRDDGYLLHGLVITARGKTIPLRRGMSTGNASHVAAEAITSYLAELGYHPRYVTEEHGTGSSKPSRGKSRLSLP